MLLRNDVLECTENKFRVLWMDSELVKAVIIDVNAPDALPKFNQIDEIEGELKSGSYKLLTNDPYIKVVDETVLPESQRRRRERAWKIIANLVTDEPRIYDASYRASCIATCVETGMATRTTIYKYLRRYWQRGQIPNALLPDYSNSGGKGKKRDSKTGIKRGRPRKYGEELGLNITKDIRKVFRVAVDRYYVSQSKFTLRGAYDQMIKDFFCNRIIDTETDRVMHTHNSDVSTSGFPSFGQFNYWFNRDNERLEIKRKRLRPRIYDKDLRGLVGTATAEVWGPGSRYEIDATIADVYLVSRVDSNKIIGRPVLYVVIDVFSRMIVGLYIGLEGPSWVGAMMALANTVSDKQSFCKQYGIDITGAEWPCHFLPAILLGDRGEIEGHTIETLINNFNVTVETTAPYRGDWKGIVEQRFRLIPAKFKPFVPGYIDTDYRARGSKDYRLDGVLNLDHFTRIIIECVLYYNNYHELKGYDKGCDVTSDNVPAVPVELWDWGIVNRSGSLRQFPEELVRFSLLPSDQATVTLNGIRFQGIFYTCQKALEERWFDHARQSGTWKVKISYDPRSVDEIYLHDTSSSRQFDICTITDRSRAYSEMSLWEVGQQQESEKQASAKRQPCQQLAAADLTSCIEGIVSEAIKQRGETNTKSARSRTKDIREHRAEEKELNRKEESFKFNAKKPSSLVSADVLQFPQVPGNDYSEPDITEMIANITKEKNDEKH